MKKRDRCAVGRADLQGSTQVDNHDEPMVNGRFVVARRANGSTQHR